MRSKIIFTLLLGLLFAACKKDSNQTNESVIIVAGGNGYGSAPNQYQTIDDIFVDASGNLYVADSWNNRIQKWAPGAKTGVIVVDGNAPKLRSNKLGGPTAIFVDAKGDIYISDYNNQRIQKWRPNDTSGVTVAGGNGRGSAANQLTDPFGVFVDNNGVIYVTDKDNSRIQKWLPGAIAGTTVAGGNGRGSKSNQLNEPIGSISIDAAGNLYVSDSFNHRVQKWEPGASAGITVAGGNDRGSGANQLNNPFDICFDNSGNLYISDSNNYRVQKWAPGATSGTTIIQAYGDDVSKNLIKSAPTAIFVDNKGNLYVADGDRVLKISPEK